MRPFQSLLDYLAMLTGDTCQVAGSDIAIEKLSIPPQSAPRPRVPQVPHPPQPHGDTTGFRLTAILRFPGAALARSSDAISG